MYNSDLPTLPLILSASKYFRFISLSFYLHPNISDRFPSHFIFVGDKMNNSQSTQQGKRDELNSFKYFTQILQLNWCTNICKRPIPTFKPQFHLEAGLVEQCYFELFLVIAYICIHTQNIFAQRGWLHLFCTFAVILVKFSAPTSFIFSV